MKRELWAIIGFTLIELLVAVAIVGVLAAAAYPSYSNSVMKSRRIDAINTLIQLQMEQEKYRARNPEYAADLSLLPVRKDGDVYLSVEGDYLIELLESSSTRFGISAVAVTGGRQEKDICQNYIIDENGPVIQGDVQRRCWNL